MFDYQTIETIHDRNLFVNTVLIIKIFHGQTIEGGCEIANKVNGGFEVVKDIIPCNFKKYK